MAGVLVRRNALIILMSVELMLNAANIRGPKFDGASAQKWLLAHGELQLDFVSTDVHAVTSAAIERLRPRRSARQYP